MNQSRIPIEFYIGVALGFLLASLMLNATCGWGAGLYPIPVLVMTTAGVIVAIVRRILRKDTDKSKRYFIYRWRVFVPLIWPLCIFGPYLGMKAYYTVEATTLPIPPGWTRIKVQTTVLGWDNGAGYYIRIEGEGVKDALKFYRNYFEKKGWSDNSDKWYMATYQKGTSFLYGKPGNRTRIAFGIHPIEYKPDDKRIIYLNFLK